MTNPDGTENTEPAGAPPPDAPPPTPANARQLRQIGLGLMLLSLLLAGLLIALWPADDPKGGVCAICITTPLPQSAQLLLIVMIAGALGSFIHTATSFSDFVGNRKLTTSWIWWYLLKPFIGMALALVLYLVVRGGLLAPGAEAGKQINIYGVVALAALAGMFSKQATDKLSEVFGTLFQTKTGAGDEKRKDSLENGKPAETKPGDTKPAVTPSVSDDHVDGCDVPITAATPDEALPPARGGVAQS
jgi:hypothetical protein